MTDPATKIRIALAVPRRDWRFWAAVSAFLATVVIACLFAFVLSDRNHWRNRFDEQSSQQLCRAAASYAVQAASADLDIAVADLGAINGRGLAVVGRGNTEELAAYADELDRRALVAEEAGLRLQEAVAAQQLALERCQPEQPPSSIPPPTTEAP